VEVDRHHERPGERQVEVVRSADARRRAADRRLRIQTRVARPGLEIAARDTELDAAHTERAPDPRLVERVADGQFAELHIAPVSDAPFVDAREGARSEGIVTIPVLADRERDTLARPNHWPRIESILADGLHVSSAVRGRRRRARRAALGILVRPVAVER